MRIVNIFGTRPQYIKVASMNRALVDDCVFNIDTGQHYDYNMAGGFINHFKIDIHSIESDIRKIRWEVDKFNPDFVLLYGDTRSTLRGALATKDHRTVHIEAGARCTLDTPEELIRFAVDHICDERFVAVDEHIKNLRNEGIDGYFCGDIMFDILKMYDSRLTAQMQDYVYMTIHRNFNSDSLIRMRALLDSIANIDKTIIFPMHPRTKKNITKFGLSLPKNVLCCDPVGYEENLSYIKFANCVITDSGGMQKEAYAFLTPCVSVMDDTPWIETVTDEYNVLASPEEVHLMYENMINKNYYPPKDHYGDGSASFRIREKLEELCGI